MDAGSRFACERCGRFVQPSSGCTRHRGSRLLDLQDPDDLAWRTEVVAMRNHRHLRMATAIAGTIGMLFSIGALGNLVTHGTAAHIYGQVGFTWFLSHVLMLLSAGLVVGALIWGGAGVLRFTRIRSALQDPIDRHAASRELAHRVAALAGALIFGCSAIVLRDVLVGVPAELVSAAIALVCTPPLIGVMEWFVTPRTHLDHQTDLLPPVADSALQDTRTADPLERVRRSALRRTIMDRR